ncbi:hypothetical protein Tco_1008702 [Tanacetum coccineum]
MISVSASFLSVRELVSHLCPPSAEDKFLEGLSNVEVVSRAYQTLGQSVIAQGELLKRHEQLSHNYVDLIMLILMSMASPGKGVVGGLKDLERERDEWRVTASSQVERIRGLEKELEPRVQQLAVVEGKTKGLENEKLTLSSKVSLCFTAGWLGGLSLGRSEDEIVQILSESEDLDIKRSRSWEAKHRELFTKSYPYIQKIADSYDLPMDELLKVSPDVPSATDKGNTSGVGTGEASQQLPPSAP